MGVINNYLFQLIFSLSHRNFLLDDFGIFLAQYFPSFVALGAIVFIFFFEGWKRRLLIFCEGTMAVILSRGIVTEVIRFFYNSQRPFQALGLQALISESSRSFPSGHAALLFAIATTIFFLSRKLGIWFLIFACVNGAARVFVGVHWPFDIVGGAAVGIISAILIHKLLESIAAQMKEKRNGTVL